MHHVFLVHWRNSPVKWHSLFQLHPLKLHKFSFLSLDLALRFQEFSLFLCLSSADYHSKIYRNSWPIFPLLQQAKHFNKTYMYFNLLLIVSAMDKKIIKKTTTKNKYTLFNISFHVYSVKIISMLYRPITNIICCSIDCSTSQVTGLMLQPNKDLSL